MTFQEMQDLFRRMFESHWRSEDLQEFDELREKFAFHMAEACDTLSNVAKIYASDSPPAVEQVTDDVELFFNDALPHLMAAANIFGDIPQIFEEQNGVHDWKSFVDDDVEPTPASALKPVK